MTLSAQGVIETAEGHKRREVTQTLEIEPFKRATVWLPLKTTTDGLITLTARGGDALDRDGMVHTIVVQKRYRLEKLATYGSTVAPAVTANEFVPPHGCREVSLVLSPSVIGNLEGAFSIQRDYSYGCWNKSSPGG